MLLEPRIHQAQAYSFEVLAVASGKHGAVVTANSCNLRICHADGPSRSLPLSYDCGVMGGRMFVEWKHHAREFVCDHLECRFLEPAFPLPFGQTGNAI